MHRGLQRYRFSIELYPRPNLICQQALFLDHSRIVPLRVDRGLDNLQFALGTKLNDLLPPTTG